MTLITISTVDLNFKFNRLFSYLNILNYSVLGMFVCISQ